MLTSEEFAKKYAGCLVSFTNSRTHGYVWGFNEFGVCLAVDKDQPFSLPNGLLVGFKQTWMAPEGHTGFNYKHSIIDMPDKLLLMARAGDRKPELLPKSSNDRPHSCPKCGSAAYVGFSKTECSSYKCTDFKA